MTIATKVFTVIAGFVVVGCLPDKGGVVEYRQKAAHADNATAASTKPGTTGGNANPADPCSKATQQHPNDGHTHGLVDDEEDLALDGDHHDDDHPPSTTPQPTPQPTQPSTSSGSNGTGTSNQTGSNTAGTGSTSNSNADCKKQNTTTTTDHHHDD